MCRQRALSISNPGSEPLAASAATTARCASLGSSSLYYLPQDKQERRPGGAGQRMRRGLLRDPRLPAPFVCAGSRATLCGRRRHAAYAGAAARSSHSRAGMAGVRTYLRRCDARPVMSHRFPVQDNYDNPYGVIKTGGKPTHLKATVASVQARRLGSTACCM